MIIAIRRNDGIVPKVDNGHAGVLVTCKRLMPIIWRVLIHIVMRFLSLRSKYAMRNPVLQPILPTNAQQHKQRKIPSERRYQL